MKLKFCKVCQVLEEKVQMSLCQKLLIIPFGIAVDTHAKRISNKMGFSKEEEPTKIEQDLLKVVPKEYYKDVNHLFVWHGRKTCIARKPQCENCPVNTYCDFYKNKQSILNIFLCIANIKKIVYNKIDMGVYLVSTTIQKYKQRVVEMPGHYKRHN